MVSTDDTLPIGRPREFDREAVVTAVVDLFWEKGYSSTSIGDIAKRTGLSRSSLYGAFGSKDELYQIALDRYLCDQRAMTAAVLDDGNRGLDDVDAFLDMIGDQVDAAGENRGCLAVNTATELRSSEQTLIDFCTQHRASLRTGFTAALERGVGLGEVDAGRVTDLANVLVTTVLGLAVMISGGASPAEVRAHLDSTRQSLRHG